MGTRKVRLVRGSEVGSFLTDRVAWKLRWVDRLVKNVPDNKLFFGDLFHKHMEHLNKTSSIGQAHDLTNQWINSMDLQHMDSVTYTELMTLFSEVSKYYEDTYFAEDLSKLTVIATELRFAIPLYQNDFEQNPLTFAYEGTIDLVYLEGGLLKFKDYKTTSSIDRYVSNSVLDRQISRYWFALQALCEGYGYIWAKDVVGGVWIKTKDHPLYDILKNFKEQGPSEFVYDIVKKETPKEPRQLKDKSLSKDKSQKTTYDLYMKAIENLRYNPDDYRDILDHLYESGNKFLRRISVRRNWNECQSAMGDFANATFEMLKVREEIANDDLSRVYYNINWDTPTFNSYYPLIQAEIMGENVSLVRAALYKTEEHDPETDFIELED